MVGVVAAVEEVVGAVPVADGRKFFHSVPKVVVAAVLKVRHQQPASKPVVAPFYANVVPRV